eukprot:7179305-Prymnesium_polylepis.1
MVAAVRAVGAKAVAPRAAVVKVVVAKEVKRAAAEAAGLRVVVAREREAVPDCPQVPTGLKVVLKQGVAMGM